MHPELHQALHSYRQTRGFDPVAYLTAKTLLLNTYFSQSGISSCVIGISGGVDSAVVAALLVHASRAPGSPLKRVVPLLLPMHAEGATHQGTATSRGSEVCSALGLSPVEVDLSSTLFAAREATFKGSGNKGTAWSAGQLVSYLRTPVLYYHAALLSEEGLPCVVCGTTNRDEGAFIGFFGKASDGMVDIQPISDLHKNEVYQLAELMRVPECVIKAVPTGDTYDGLCDEEMIGTSYDFLELYEFWLCENKQKKKIWWAGLGEPARREFQSLGAKLEALHSKNKHKYIGDSPAVHLDLLARAVPRGWRHQEGQEVSSFSRESALAARVGPVELPLSALAIDPDDSPTQESVLDFGECSVLVRRAIPQAVCRSLLSGSDSWEWVKADNHGRKIKTSPETVQVGSYRATAFNESFADYLWQRLADHLPRFRSMTELTPTDHNGYPVWRPVGVNPMLRFIRYENGGSLVPHYDAGFDFQDGKRHTLMSIVITLTESSGDGGSGTRFLVDQQRNIPLDERNFEDWNGGPKMRDVLLEVSASSGDALLFDHRILHDAPQWQGAGSRIILRTDLIFERCAPHAISWSPLQESSALKLQTKWAQDPTYRKAYDVLGTEEAVEHAGYFDDGLTERPQLDPGVWAAPLGVLFDNLSRSTEQSPQAPLAVLVTTGSFCPLHVGHIDMMRVARQTAEKAGKVVLAGFIVPDHDSYVSQKCGLNALSAAQRVHLAEEAVRGTAHDWLIVDHWTALYSPADVNFTTVIDRIAAQLAYHLKIARSVEVIYVCGGDNARFALSFVKRGACIVVSRPGFEESVKDVKANPAVCSNPRILFTDGDTSPAASTAIRNGDLADLPKGIVSKYLEMKSLVTSQLQVSDEEANFFMRHEGEWAVAHWSNLPGINPTRLTEAYLTFCKDLASIFDEIFTKAHLRTGGPKVHMVALDLSAQRTEFESLRRSAAVNSQTIISLDPCLPADLNLSLSRCFAPLSAGSDCSHVARPGAPCLPAQLARIKAAAAATRQETGGAPGLLLFDDDASTGGTARAARAMLAGLEPPCVVDRFVALGGGRGADSDSGGGDDGDANGPRPRRLDLVDCRDFLVGAREGGLVVWLPQWRHKTAEVEDEAGRWLCRMPYALPFVRPAYRAGVPVDDEVAFSKRVWELNARFFSRVGGLTVGDAGDAFAALAQEWFGVESDIAMDEFVSTVSQRLPARSEN